MLCAHIRIYKLWGVGGGCGGLPIEVPLRVRDLFRLVPPGTSIQALVMFVPGARMSTTMVVNCLALPLEFMGEGGLTLAIV